MIRWPIFSLLLLLGWACATPVPPSGGPVDKTPPDLVDMYPPSNSVDFDGSTIRFEFSERVDRAAFERSLTIVPELSAPPELKWKGRVLEMTFADSLAEGTTYVFTIDNTLRDEHSVALTKPIVRAIATGSVIDSGKISGYVKDPATNRGVPNVDVIATRVDTTGTGVRSGGVYRTQTDPEGAFELSFLPETPFFVFALEDRNRNRTVDSGERFGAPPEATIIPAPGDSVVMRPLFWIIYSDTTSPSVTSIQARSSRRLEIRYNEPISLETLDPSGWAVRDTLSGKTYVVDHLYRDPEDARRVTLVTDSLPAAGYRIDRFGAVTDSAGNHARNEAPPFAVEAIPDTLRLRFLGFASTNAPGAAVDLAPRRQPTLRFNRPLQGTRLSAVVSAEDTTGVRREFTSWTADSTTWTVVFVPPLAAGETVRLRVAPHVTANDSALVEEFRRLTPAETGSFSGFVQKPGSLAVIELYPERAQASRAVLSISTTGDFHIDGLETGNYRLRAFSDRNGNGAWDWGNIDPYDRPEVLVWYSDSARVRAGWETVLDTLRLTGR